MAAKKAVEVRKRALKVVIAQQTEQNRAFFNYSCAKARRLIRQEKRQQWNRFLANVELRKKPKQAFRLLRKLTEKAPATLNQPLTGKAGKQLITDRKRADEHAKTFAQAGEDTTCDLNPKYEGPKGTYYEGFDKEFSIDELRIAFCTFRPYGSPGKDFVYNIMLKHMGMHAQQGMVQMFNEYLRQGKLPKARQTEIIRPALKPNKDASKAANYRPMST